MNICNILARNFRQKSLLNAQNVMQTAICGIKERPRYVETRIITQEEVDQFAKLTGDTNFIHSIECPPDARCVHGAFLNAMVAGIIGTKMPGPGSIVVQQEFTFPQKCVCNEEIIVTVRLLENRHIKKIGYECRQNGMAVFVGTANIIVKNINIDQQAK